MEMRKIKKASELALQKWKFGHTSGGLIKRKYGMKEVNGQEDINTYFDDKIDQSWWSF